MIRLSRKYRFSASHRLFRREWSDERNREVYGKCANPFGHGHDYDLEVIVSGSVNPVTGRVVSIAEMDSFVERSILSKFRYRNLNEEIPAFHDSVPTTENLAIEIDSRLRNGWAAQFSGTEDAPVLEMLRIWETERNICELTGKG